MLSKSIEKININNYQKLQDAINKIDNSFMVSALNLYNWKFYNIDVFFKITDKAVFLYSHSNNFQDTYIFRPIISKEDEPNIKDFYIESINNVKDFIKGSKKIRLASHYETDLSLFENAVEGDSFNAAYIYKTEKLKYMSGKKMQKKRNFVNFYTKNYEEKSKLIKYEDKYYNDVIEFCIKESINPETLKVRETEINSAKELIKLNLDNAIGSILFYEDEMVGFTYGYIINNKFEIFIEKANSKLKGSYQYLLSHNLQLNDVNVEWVDRQDDMSSGNLEKSKRSYYPEIIWKLMFFQIDNNF